MKKLILTILFIVPLITYAQVPITFEQAIKIPGYQTAYHSVEVSDGYVCTGESEGNLIIMKTNKNGDTLWTNTIGGSSQDYATYIESTSDGGFILAARTTSFGGGLNGNTWIIKTDSLGQLQWHKYFTSFTNARGLSVKETHDNKYVAISSLGGIVKLDENGNVQWINSLSNYLYRPMPYLTVENINLYKNIGIGYTNVYTSNDTLYADYGILETSIDSSGTITNSKLLSFNSSYYAEFIINDTSYIEAVFGDTISDKLHVKTFVNGLDINSIDEYVNGYIIAGNNTSNGILLKSDFLGNLDWQLTIDTVIDIKDVVATIDDEYVITGYTMSTSEDVYIAKIDEFGNIIWSRTFNGDDYDVPSDILESFDNGYLVTATTESFGSINSDIYIIKLDQAGNIYYPPEAQDICIVTTDTSGHSVIVCEKPIAEQYSHYIIYKESDQAEIYDSIGILQYDEFSVFIDTESNIQQQANIYKVSIVDTLGLESLTSEAHKLIHLTVNEGPGGSWNLIWNHYQGFNYSSYDIYRGSQAEGLTYLTTISSNQNSYTDTDPPTGVVYYQVVCTNPNGCTPTAKTTIDYSSSKSNIADNKEIITNINNLNYNNQYIVYPNPFKDEAILHIKNMNHSEKNILIHNQVGQIVISFNTTNDKVILKRDNLPSGIYYITVTGKYTLNGKLIIE